MKYSREMINEAVSSVKSLVCECDRVTRDIECDILDAWCDMRIGKRRGFESLCELILAIKDAKLRLYE